MSGPFRSKQAAKEGLQEIGSIIDLCRQMGMSNIKVAPLLATNYDLHRNGTIFESHIVRGKSRDIIAAGGRYDEVGRSDMTVTSHTDVARLAGLTKWSPASPLRKSACLADARTSLGSLWPFQSSRWPPPKRIRLPESRQ